MESESETFGQEAEGQTLSGEQQEALSVFLDDKKNIENIEGGNEGFSILTNILNEYNNEHVLDLDPSDIMDLKDFVDFFKDSIEAGDEGLANLQCLLSIIDENDPIDTTEDIVGAELY